MNTMTYIKSFLAFLVIAAFLVHPLELPLKKAWQLLDQTGFEQRYCVNLNHPELDCHGSCQIREVATQLAHHDSNDAQISPTPLLLDLFFESADTESLTPIYLSEKAPLLPYMQDYSCGVFFDIFHPPRLG